MKNHRRVMNFIFLPLLVLVVIIGIALFFVRAQIMPESIGHELTMKATTSSPLINIDEFVVLIHDSHLNKLNDILSPLGLEMKFPLLNWIVVKSKKATNEIAPQNSNEASRARLILNALLNNPLVLDAHHNFIVEKTANTVTENAGLSFTDAWKFTTGSPDVYIAVVDQFSVDDKFNFPLIFPKCSARVTHFLPRPLEKTGQELKGYFEQVPHGEPILEALGACNNVKPFSAGVDQQAKIIAAEPASKGHAEVFLTALLVSGIDVCRKSIVPCQEELPISAQKPDILLLPFGNNAPELLQITADIIDAINAVDVIIVSSAGNDQMNANSFFPGANTHVINVAALDHQGARADFSNWGGAVELLAPGDDIEIIYPNGPKTISGTSMAAAYVAGIIALQKAINKKLSAGEARQLLMFSADKMSCDQYCKSDESCRDLCCNNKLSICNMAALNMAKALSYVSSPPSLPRLLLDQSYYLYLRDEPEGKEIIITNKGRETAEVTLRTFDEHIHIAPQQFTLSPGASQQLKISFKREPFVRQIFKFVAVAYQHEKIIDRTEFHVEYIPRR